MKDLTPRRIVEYLDEYIVGQQNAKRSVAVALRNRWRSSRLPKEIAREVSPKNILLIGPTGVGKTEIARRIAALTGAPFVKVEATKYTEVGYVGRDVESMVRDLAEEAVRLVKKQESGRHGKDAEEAAVQKIAEMMWPAKKKETRSPMEIILGEKAEKTGVSDEGERERRKNLLARIRSGELDDRQIEVELEEKGNIEDTADNEQANRISQIFASMMPKKMKKRKMTVRMAKTVLAEVSAEEMVDMDVVRDRAVALAEERGMQIEFGEAQLKEAHPNTAQLYLQGQEGRSLEIIGQSLGGSRINIAEIDGIETNFSGDYPTLVVHNQDQPGHVAEVTSMLSHKGVNIAYMQLYRSSRGGEAVMVVECDQEIPKEGIDWLKKVEGVKKVTYLGHDTEAMDKGGTAR